MKEWAQGGPDYQTREHETDLAMKVAGVEWEQWDYPDTDPDWEAIRFKIANITIPYPGLVIGPAWELGGHEQHNEIASMLDEYVHTPSRVRYLSYVRGHGRSESPNEVVPTAAERILKDVALACYQSQKDFPPTAPWFDPSDQREFLA